MAWSPWAPRSRNYKHRSAPAGLTAYRSLLHFPAFGGIYAFMEADRDQLIYLITFIGLNPCLILWGLHA